VITHPVLEAAARHGVRLGSERMASFLLALGEPHRAWPAVHIGGTNGKGSTTTMVTAALVDAGFRVGTTISPHLQAVNERIQIDGVAVADAVLAGLIEDVDRQRWDWAAASGSRDNPLTYFELITAAAFLHFQRERVDIAVVEVGMGGRLDATNVVEPLATAITTVGLDHQAELGPTVEAIAAEKAGILKRGVPAVHGAMPEGAAAVIARTATAVGAPLWRPGAHLRRELRAGAWNLSTPAGALTGVRLGMPGAHQGGNAVVALALLHHLRVAGLPIPDDAIRSGLERARIAGRLERIAPDLLVDGAHNEEGARALAAFLAGERRPRRRILLFGMGDERDPAAILSPLLPHVDEVVCTRCAHPKAREPEALAHAVSAMHPVVSIAGAVEEALPEARADADEVVVAGSLYLVGAVRDLVGSRPEA
jgi:dihydrofolate synthase/folylpolyglutamate synthase